MRGLPEKILAIVKSEDKEGVTCRSGFTNDVEA